MAPQRPGPSGGTITRESFFDAEGNPVDRDGPWVRVEVEVTYPDGRVERTYGTVGG